MKTFDVFQLPDGGYLAIKRGFNWATLFFGWIWCFFVAKLNGWGILCLGIFVIGRVIGTAINPSHNPNDFFWIILIFSVFELSFAIWFAANANNFRKSQYTQLGYRILQESIYAPDRFQAISIARADSNKNSGVEVRLEPSSKNLKNLHKDSVKSLKSLQRRNVLSDNEYKVAEVRAEEVYEQQKQFEEKQKQLKEQQAAEQKLQEKLKKDLAELTTMYEKNIIDANTYAAAKGRLYRTKNK